MADRALVKKDEILVAVQDSSPLSMEHDGHSQQINTKGGTKSKFFGKINIFNRKRQLWWQDKWGLAEESPPPLKKG